MATITEARSDLSKILLVACDQSYQGGPQASPPSPKPIGPGDALSAFPDSRVPGGDVFPNTVPDDWRTLTLSDWVVQQRYDEPLTGFGATLYRRATATDQADYIVAMQGTRGPNIQDWAGNLIYGWDKWSDQQPQGGQTLLNNLVSLIDVNQIHFTGQSLGGALAEYALYDYATQKSDFDPTKVTLTTFNGLGGIAGLEQNRGTVDGSLVSGVDTAHFYITNDLVSRLGEGHLNGSDNEYLLDFAQTDTPGSGLILHRGDGSAIALDPFSAHRIEPGFYSGFNRAYGVQGYSWPSSFAQAQNKPISALHVEELTRVGSYVAWLTNQDGALSTKTEAWARAIAALTYSLAFGNRDELRSLSDAIIDSLYASDVISRKELRDFGKLWIPNFVHALAASSSGRFTHLAAQYVALLAETSGSSAKVDTQEGLGPRVIELVGGANLAGATPKFDPDAAGADASRILSSDFGKEKSEVLYVKAATFSLLAALYAIPSIVESLRYAAAESILPRADSLSGDASAFAREALQATAKALGGTINDVVGTFSRALAESSKALVDTAVQIGKISGALGIDGRRFLASEKDSVSTGLIDVARSLSNAYSDLTLKFADAFEWGSSLSRSALTSVIGGLVSEARADAGDTGPGFNAAIRSLEFAIQSVVIREGRGDNPFASPAFAPDASPVSVGSLSEGSVRTFTAYLAYDAGTGGQRIKLSLAGSAAGKLTLLDLADEVTLGSDGVFTLVVPEGRRELSFGLWAKQDIDTGTTLQLSAQLVDAADEATHLEHIELNLALESVAETPPVTTREIRGDWAPVPYVDATTGKTYYKTDDLFNIERLAGVPSTGDVETDQWLDGSGGGDHIVTGDFDEQARGGGGDDFITGSENTGNILIGGPSSDRIEGGGWANHVAEYWEWQYLGRPMGLGDDKIYGGAGDDQIWGESEATQAALNDASRPPTGITGDWLTGGSGSDRIYGSAGDDVLLGGIGADTLAGGPGMDVLLGDDDFQIRPTGNYWRVVYPNFGDTTPGYGGFELGLFPVVNATSIAPDLIWAVTGDPDFTYYKNGGGGDVLIGGAGRDVLIGQYGDDTLYGGDDGDILAGWEGSDELVGGAGDDLMAGDFGRYEQVNQRPVPGTLLVTAGVMGTSAAFGSAVDLIGNDLLDGGAGDDVLYGEGGDDAVLGDDGDDTLYGDATYLPEDLHGQDILDGGAGDDALDGGAGDDTLAGGAGDDELIGGSGNDLLDGGIGDDALSGDHGDDRLRGGEGADTLDGGDGADELRAGAGDDTLDGGDGDDALYGESGADEMDGGAGNDRLYGGAGADVIAGGEGDDLIDGGEGIDVVRGGEGDDTYALGFGYGRDVIEDSEGTNRIRFGSGILPEDLRGALDGDTLGATLTYSAIDDAVSIDMSGFALSGIDFADGGSWTQKDLVDLLPALVADGASGDEMLEGQPNLKNALHGRGGDDALAGGGYDDVLDGGDGSDTADGHGGSDTYYFAGTESGFDRIEDSGIDAIAYLDAYYGALGITDWRTRAAHAGEYRVTRQAERWTNDVYYDTYDEALAENPGAAIDFIEPLPSLAPLVERNDGAAIDQLVAAGVMARDVVRFGPGVALADLALRITVPAASADAYPEQPWRDGGTLSVRWATGGFEVAVPDVSYGFTGSSLPAEPDAYRLGEGIEAFEFDDGTVYTLEEVLAQASVLPLAGAYHIARDSGLHLIAPNYEAIVFDDAIRSYEV